MEIFPRILMKFSANPHCCTDYLGRKNNITICAISSLPKSSPKRNKWIQTVLGRGRSEGQIFWSRQANSRFEPLRLEIKVFGSHIIIDLLNIMSAADVLQSIQYTRGSFKVLDQLKVPHELVYRDIESVKDAVDAIKTMQVRGAPLIAMVGCLSVAVELHNGQKDLTDNQLLMKYLDDRINSLILARPTAVNMRKEGQKLLEQVKEWSAESNDSSVLRSRVIEYCETLLKLDLADNIAIGNVGAEAILNTGKLTDGRATVLTHCNTGSLATSGVGTALGVIRALHQQQKLEHVFFTETRPYNQGARLTSFELLHEKIPSTLICDSAASWLMRTKNVSAVVVGADRVTRNGDTANKVGTYQLAVTAKHHNVPFYIAAPFSSIDPSIESGDGIVIEQRSSDEVTSIGGIRIAPIGVSVWNPAFDVTPAELITGIVTEKGIFTPDELRTKL
ncbi:unnamed protein product [Allacma fusca]|uniref:Methylthioribose-1-phosphate isomerase n=1 Tax=Allacma fusca TaxID=39272 RepID=A0A8J2P3W9_9HEXA|nr:unnamed protein product [Allacma fusca]